MDFGVALSAGMTVCLLVTITLCTILLFIRSNPRRKFTKKQPAVPVTAEPQPVVYEELADYTETPYEEQYTDTQQYQQFPSYQEVTSFDDNFDSEFQPSLEIDWSGENEQAQQQQQQQQQVQQKVQQLQQKTQQIQQKSSQIPQVVPSKTTCNVPEIPREGYCNGDSLPLDKIPQLDVSKLGELTREELTKLAIKERSRYRDARAWISKELMWNKARQEAIVGPGFVHGQQGPSTFGGVYDPATGVYKDVNSIPICRGLRESPCAINTMENENYVELDRIPGWYTNTNEPAPWQGADANTFTSLNTQQQTSNN